MSMAKKRGIAISAAVSLIAFIFMGMSYSANASRSEKDDTKGIVALPGYHVSLFAKGNSSYSHPDSVVVDGKYIYVGYQNVTAKDGTDNKSSTIVQYNRDGEVLDTYSVLGHTDGLRIDPATHLVWVTCNEDGNPNLYIINPKTETVTRYFFPVTPHGGGYDDLAFANGYAFIAASNPTLNSAGINVFPALDKVSFDGNKVVLTPVLMGNATALDTTTNQNVTLNEIDPDSLNIDNAGDVVLTNQAGSELVFLHKAGTAQQTVTRVPVGTQLDDTIWTPSNETDGRFLVVDGAKNAIYAIDATFKAGTVFTESPSDSGVASFVGTVDLTTGTVTPTIIGFGSPTGLIFVPEQ